VTEQTKDTATSRDNKHKLEPMQLFSAKMLKYFVQDYMLTV